MNHTTVSLNSMRKTSHPQIFALDMGVMFVYYHAPAEGEVHPMRHCGGGIYICEHQKCDPFNETDFFPVERLRHVT